MKEIKQIWHKLKIKPKVYGHSIALLFPFCRSELKKKKKVGGKGLSFFEWLMQAGHQPKIFTCMKLILTKPLVSLTFELVLLPTFDS